MDEHDLNEVDQDIIRKRKRNSINKSMEEKTIEKRIKHTLQEIVNHLSHHPFSKPFSQPIHRSDGGMPPDYFQIIQHPIDIKTIQEKIDLDGYQTCQDIHDDVQLMCDNNLIYNPPESFLHHMSVTLSHSFHRMYTQLIYRSNSSFHLRDHIDRSSIRSPMSEDEQRELIIKLNKIDDKYLDVVINIILNAYPRLEEQTKHSTDTDRLVINLGALTPDLIHQLNDYISDRNQSERRDNM